MANVGIDAMAFEPGSLKLDLTEVFAEHKEEDPEKYTKGLGIREISLPDTDEDIVTMGANAALEVMEREGLEPSDIGRIDVATESSFDRSKPASTYIAGCLEEHFRGDFNHADKGERKFACIAGTQVLNDALNWIQAGVNNGKKALIVMTDTAFYERGDSGEATQGAGSVAMIVDSEPRMVEINRNHGYGSSDEVDFLKPNQQYPSVDGPKSVKVYLNRMKEAIQSLESEIGKLDIESYALTPFHTPFPGMVRKAAPLGYRHGVMGTEKGEVIESKIGQRPVVENYDSESEFESDMTDWMDRLTETSEYKEWYSRVVEPTVELPSMVGNWYTASVHVARISGMWSCLSRGVELTGEKMLVASYGSGAQSEVHVETLKDGWKSGIEDMNIRDKLNSRKEIEDFETYEIIHKSHRHDVETSIEPLYPDKESFCRSGFGDMGERQYARISSKSRN